MEFKVYRYIPMALLCALGLEMNAQTETDVLRYSNTHFGGTARYNSMAGAFGAVGADFSVLSTNPAGMARFRGSDFSFTPSLNLTKTDAIHNGSTSFDSKENLNINNIGLVAVSKASPESPSLWRSVQFGFGYNKLANFHSAYSVNGLDTNSFSMVLADQGYGATEDELWNNQVSPFMAAPAYAAWLIDPLNGSGGKEVYTTQMYVDSIQQNHSAITKGSLGETSFAMSGNYNDKIYIGASVNFQRLRYESVKIHEETSLIDTTDLISFTYTENLATIGRGINLKVGAIFLPTPWLRIGGAYHSPTAYYTMNDVWSTSINTNWRTSSGDRTESSYAANSPNGNYTYKMTTPQRFLGSLAFVIKKRGMISLDYELVDYTDGSLKAHRAYGDGYSFELENARVGENFVAGNNIRLGGELRLTNLWMLRGGAAMYQSPYNSEVVSQTTPRMTYAGGIGYRASNFYFDVAYTLTKSTEDYYKFDPLLTSNALITTKTSNIFATIGFKF